MCSFGLVVVYCRRTRFSGYTYSEAAKAASAHSWKPDRISFFFARINVDIADGSWHVGFEKWAVSTTICFLSSVRPQSAIGPSFGWQPRENEQVFSRNAASDAVGAGDLNFGHLAVFFLKPVT